MNLKSYVRCDSAFNKLRVISSSMVIEMTGNFTNPKKQRNNVEQSGTLTGCMRQSV